MTLYQGQRYAEQIVPWLAPYCERIEIVGSVRRRRPVCNDVDLVCIPRLTTETRQVDMFTTERVVTSQLRQFLVEYVNGGNGSWLGRDRPGLLVSGGEPLSNKSPEPKSDAQNLLLNLRSGVQLDIFCATAQTWATLQLCRTGSKEHNIWFAQRAIDHGGHWNPYKGLHLSDGLVTATTEEELYAALKLPYIAPENREPHFLRSLR
jgi:DNA polymerase/3'-5' exonuclease PolX